MAIAVLWGYLEKNPFAGVKLIHVPERTPRYMEGEEFKKLFSVIGQKWLRDIVFFAIHTGARRSEIVNLKWSNVDLSRRIVSFESDGSYRVKAGKRRSVPLNNDICSLLLVLKENSRCEYVFNFNDKPIDAELVSHKFKKCLKRAKLNDKLHFHSLRATFAIWLVIKGAPIYSVSKLLGHSDVSTTQKYYAHLESDQLHDVVSLINVA